MERADPVPGEIWRHVASGGHYRILHIAQWEATWAPVVVYQNIVKTDSAVWVRLLSGVHGADRCVRDAALPTRRAGSAQRKGQAMKLRSLLHRLLGRSDVAIAGDVYMRRWRFFSTRWFSLRVHQIMRSDADRELHDHPFAFLSLILRGGYVEHRADGSSRTCRAPALVFRRAETLHRLELLDGPTWTFVVTGPRRREWGFMTADGWVTWEAFTAGKQKTEPGEFTSSSSY